MGEKVHGEKCPGSRVWNYITRNDNQTCQVLLIDLVGEEEWWVTANLKIYKFYRWSLKQVWKIFPLVCGEKGRVVPVFVFTWGMLLIRSEHRWFQFLLVVAH